MKEKSAVEQGWDFAAHLAGVDFAADAGHDYVLKVAKAIEQVEDSINNHPYRGQDISFFKGYVAEESTMTVASIFVSHFISHLK